MPQEMRVLEVELRREFDIALALRAANLAKQRRRDGLRCRAGEDRTIRQVESLGADFEPTLLADAELLAERQVEAAHPGPPDDADTGIPEGAGRRGGVRCRIQEQKARSNQVRVV